MMEAVENGGVTEAGGPAHDGGGVASGELAGADGQATVEQWQAALQELCKSAQASGQPQAYFAGAAAGAQGYGLWGAQPLLAAYGAIPFFSGVFPGSYSLPQASVPPSPPEPADEAGEESGGATSETRPPARPAKRARTRGGARHQEDGTGGGGAEGPRASSPRGGAGPGRPGGRGSQVVPGKGGLSIDALAAAARAAARSSATSSSDFWRNADGSVELQKDDKELKRQRRKQSNRESARRSRLRKQQECENLHGQVRELSDENVALRREVRELQELLEQMRKQGRKEKMDEESMAQDVE
ncbi:unnamed protein product [Ostreobium quekettii]|uniref:BZIP domain-containing protein n=1 Tax=Ostreobium quekettii TaxID=121088 RepID=A0A8S1INK6_9CHLO|nr:unnamed protein product [Ostreobium quekettii]|eukprot:evm.model.scf_3682.1 EVM.evm.TU.scf_3682.1   scf_3682:616-2691(+)